MRSVLALMAAAVVLLPALWPGSAAGQGSLTLWPGWNNIVYPGPEADPEAALGETAVSVQAIWHWDARAQAWTRWFPGVPAISDLDTLVPGRAYWVRSTATTTWTSGGGGQTGLATALLELRGDAGAREVITVELADTASKRSTGLMFRESLPEDRGMLFLFPADSQGGFWMQNTYIPLSIAFIDSQGVIVDILDMEPLTTEVHTPDAPYRWALEMNQGWFASNGIAEGDSVRLTGS